MLGKIRWLMDASRSGVLRSWRLAVFFVLAGFSGHAIAAAQDACSSIPVHLYRVSLGPSSAVSFNYKCLGKIPTSSLTSAALRAAQFNDNTYQVQIDLSATTWIAQKQFSFQLYVNRSSEFGASVYEYQVDEDTTGAFNDTEQTVPIDVGAANDVHSGTITVPLHSPLGPSSGLTYTPSASRPYQPISTEGDTSFTINLTNNLAYFSSTLQNPTVISGCGGCMQVQAKFTNLSGDNQLRPNTPVTVQVDVNTNLWQALQASLHPEGADDAYDSHIMLDIPMTPSHGMKNDQMISIPIKFSPPWQWTLLGTLLGSLLGGLIRIYLSKSRGWRSFAYGFFLAVVAELVAIWLFSSPQSGLKIFGVSLKPTQAFSAFMFCLLVGGGPALVKALKTTVAAQMLGGKADSDA